MNTVGLNKVINNKNPLSFERGFFNNKVIIMVNLTKQQTYQFLLNKNKFESINRKIKFKTLHKWWCLNCGKEIFVNYDAISLQNIFCNSPDCKHKYKKPNIVQFQYLKKLKEYQLKLFNNIK